MVWKLMKYIEYTFIKCIFMTLWIIYTMSWIVLQYLLFQVLLHSVKKSLLIMHFVSEHESIFVWEAFLLSMQLLCGHNIHFRERTIHGLCKINFTVQCEMGRVVNYNKEQNRIIVWYSTRKYAFISLLLVIALTTEA